MDQISLYSTIKTHSDLENSEANRLASVIWGEVLRYGKFWEKDAMKKCKDRPELEWACLKKKDLTEQEDYHK